MGAGAVPGATGEVLFMQPSTVGVKMLLLAAALGVSSIIGAGLLMRGYQMGKNASVALFDYSYLVWAALVSTALWGQAPTATGLAGLVLIMLAGVVAIAPRRRAVADRAISSQMASFGDSEIAQDKRIERPPESIGVENALSAALGNRREPPPRPSPRKGEGAQVAGEEPRLQAQYDVAVVAV